MRIKSILIILLNGFIISIIILDNLVVGGHMISVKNLTKIFMKKEEFKAVDNISFEIKEGEIVGLLGSNGAGKSSTIKMVCGLLTPDAGQVSVFGLDISKSKNLKSVLKKSSFLLEGQRSIYFYFSLLENIKYFLALKGISYKENKKYIEELIEFFGLKGEEHIPVGTFSTGMKQKVSIIIALAGDEDLIVLDEPTLGLDVHSANNMVRILKEFVQKKRKTVLITAHNMKVIENLCERVIVIEKGKIIKDDSIGNFKHLFDITQVEITCENINKEDIGDLNFQENIDGTYSVQLQLDNSQLGSEITKLELSGARILSIKSDNSDFESNYVNFIEDYKGGKAI